MPSKFKKPKIKRSNPEALNTISKAMKKTGFVEVGVISPEVHKDSELTVAAIAFYNEFGTGDIPERPFIRSTLKEERQAISTLSQGLLKEILKGKRTPANGLGVIGEVISDKIKQKIVDIKTPPNAPGTVKAKGSSNPLIDTSQMKNSITYEVKSGNIHK